MFWLEMATVSNISKILDFPCFFFLTWITPLGAGWPALGAGQPANGWPASSQRSDPGQEKKKKKKNQGKSKILEMFETVAISSQKLKDSLCFGWSWLEGAP